MDTRENEAHGHLCNRALCQMDDASGDSVYSALRQWGQEEGSATGTIIKGFSACKSINHKETVRACPQPFSRMEAHHR